MSKYILNKDNGSHILPPIPTNEFENNYFNVIMMNTVKQNKIDTEKNLKQREMDMNVSNVNKINITVCVGIGILAIGLVNLGAGTERTLANIKEVLDNLNKHAEDLVKLTAQTVNIISNLSMKRLIFGGGKT
jgi:branched-subunit amino acid permease